MAAYFDDSEEKKDEAPADAAPAAEEKAAPAADSGCSEPSCEAEEDSCGDEVECGSECVCNGDLCSGWSLCNCCPGDAWTLQKYLTPCSTDVTYAGWMEVGYHSQNTGLSRNDNDLLDTNDVPGDFNLQQGWLYMEKLAKAEACCSDWGYRFDIMYGTDAQKTQAFGNSGAGSVNGPQGWDNGWDNGKYGWAMPQAYLQYATGDWSWKIGHWYTPMGYEVFPATGNFFYSHSFSFFNSEPFTHTGALGTYTANENMTYYAGWALGWDTGFDQFDNGNIFIGGFSRKLSDDVTFGYMTCVGDLGFRSGDEFGYSHTILLTTNLTDKTQYILQSDLVAADGLFGNDDTSNFDVGIVNYLLHTVNDCWKVGGRFEWWQTDQLGDTTSFFEVTGGVNYKPHANVVIRPEIRFDFTSDEDTTDDDFNRAIFGIDGIFTF
jgi:hypothetical protein